MNLSREKSVMKKLMVFAIGLVVGMGLFAMPHNLIQKTPCTALEDTGTMAGPFHGTGPVDGVLLIVGDRVLVTSNATNDVWNGIWEVGNDPEHTWIRPRDFEAGSAAHAAFTIITQGETYHDTRWICTSTPGHDIVGLDALIWSESNN
jgi:hypothetical protein